jgi:6,7-dimethyl-8-ribityllumazine synthase
MSSKAAPTPPTEPAPPGSRFAIVCARWNAEITDRLLDGALTTLRAARVTDDRLLAVRVPGAFELPVVASRLAKTGQFDAVICLGAVIKGDTDHDRYINDSVAHALQTIGIETDVPALFGVLTCNDLQQAVDRAGGKAGNKGAEAAAAAIEMATLLRKLQSGGR